MKMKYIYRRWLFLMAGALLVANFASCNDNDENSPILPPAYSVDRSNMFGIHEQPKVGENSWLLICAGPWELSLSECCSIFHGYLITMLKET